MRKLYAIMYTALVLNCLATLLCVSVTVWEYVNENKAVSFTEPELTIYQIASHKTGCPEWILKGIRFAESSYGTNCAHPDPLDIGDYGLHETPEYHAERATKYGEYNPYCPLQSAIIAGHIIMEHYEKMGDMEQAISAYRHGRVGTYRNGIDWQYVSRVKYGWSLYCSV